VAGQVTAGMRGGVHATLGGGRGGGTRTGYRENPG
jgi:hypothetical protein